MVGLSIAAAPQAAGAAHHPPCVGRCAQQCNQRLQLVAGHLDPMRRIGVALGCRITTQKCQAASINAAAGSKPEVIFETDARHSNTYRYEPPMGLEKYVEPIDEVLDLGIDTIS